MQNLNIYNCLFMVIFIIAYCKIGAEIKPSLPESETEITVECNLSNTQYTYITALSGMNIIFIPEIGLGDALTKVGRQVKISQFFVI